jgi:hypothetical protein
VVCINSAVIGASLSRIYILISNIIVYVHTYCNYDMQKYAILYT